MAKRTKRAKREGQHGFEPKLGGGHGGPLGPQWTEPADRRSGNLRGREPHGQGARQMSRDPRDGGRPRGKTPRQRGAGKRGR